MDDLYDLAYLNAVENVEEAELLVNHGPRQMYMPHDPLDLSDKQFVNIHRLNRNNVDNLIDILQPYIAVPNRVGALTVERKVLTALRFLGSGSYQMDIGHNLNHAVCQASVSRCIEEVTNAIISPEIFHGFVRLPLTIPELVSIRNRFFENYGLPGIVGCIDCTHIAIFPPHVDDPNFPEVAYVNRKGYHSINTKLSCYADLRIMNVSARFPGSSNDMHIWNNSNALNYITALHRNGHNSFYFIGDSGYYLTTWLMTPIPDAVPGSPEER